MNTAKIMGAAVVAALTGGLYAQTLDCQCGKSVCRCVSVCACTSESCKCPNCGVDSGLNYEPEASISFNETPIVSAEFGVGLDSRYMTYGVIDGKDPIVVPNASLTFFDWVYFGVEAIFDTTKGNGKRGGYGNRAGKYTTLDSMVGLAHDFDLGETLGSLGVDFSYMYEYLPRHDGEVGDTQYLNLELSLGDLWLEPAFAIERDLMADDGTYAYFELGHTFEVSESVTLRPSVGQGLGNSLRTRGYFSELEKVEGFDHGGMMDTTLRIDLEYALADWLTFGAYVAYHDYLFDGNMREAAAAYNGEWGAGENKTWNVVGGLSLTASF